MKRLLQLLTFCVGISLLFAACSSDKTFTSFSSSINLTGSTQYGADQSVLLYSLDNGATFTQFPVLKDGQKYLAAVGDLTVNEVLSTDVCASIHWAGSIPAPVDTATNYAQLTLTPNTHIVARVTDLVDANNKPYTAFRPKAWTGAWGGDEVGACCGGTDANNITEDSSDPNKFYMDNFWGDHVSVYMEFTTSTNSGDQVVTIPTQTTSEGGVASGTGTYNQCNGTFTIATKYVIGGTYQWQYNFHR